MVIMEPPTSMSYRIKELLLRAWRERWSEVDFGRNIKRLLPRGVSGDVYDLADCILRQAVAGPVPNTLLMSYVNHCLGAQVVSFGAVIQAIVKVQDPKPSCNCCLLEFLHKHRTRISCYGNEDECISLCRALIRLLHWLFQIVATSVDEHAKTNNNTEDSSRVHFQILKLSAEMLNYLTQSAFLKSLLYVGKLDDPLLWTQFIKQYKEVSSKMAVLSDRSNESIFQAINNLQSNIPWLNADLPSSQATAEAVAATPSPTAPVVDVAIRQLTSYSTYIRYRPIAYRCLQAAISFGAVLERFNTAEVMANQIAMIGRYFDIGLPQIYCESLHACFVSLIEAQKLNMENPKYVNYFHKWVAFFLFKLPQVFLCLSRQRQLITPTEPVAASAPTDFEVGLDLLILRSPLLDLFTSLLPGEYLPKFIDELEKLSLLSAKASEKFLQSRKMTKLPAQATAEMSSVLVVRAEITLITVLESFQSDDPETLLGILCRMHNSLEVMLCTSACTGSLTKFAQKLVTLNENSKVSSGENLRTSQMRAVLFDISFLLLCSLVQNFGSEVITNQADLKDSFFAKWCSLNFTEDLSPDTILSDSLESTKLDPLLSQLIVSSTGIEFKTSLIRWADVCIAVQVAISEVMSAATHGTFSMDTVKVFIERLKSKLCFPSVVASCLLIAQLKVASQKQAEVIMTMLAELKIPSSGEEIATETAAASQEAGLDSLMMFYKERSVILQGIMKHLFNKHLPHTANGSSDKQLSCKSTGLSPAIPLRMSRSSLNDMLKGTLKATQGHFTMQNIYDFDGLVALGGPRWFTNAVVGSLFNQSEIVRLQQAVDMAYGLFHLDLEQCALALLRYTIPRILLFKSHQDSLSEPRVTALVRLAIMTTFGAISHLQSLTKSGLSRRSAHRRQYEDSAQEWQLGRFNAELLENTAFSFEAQTTLNGTAISEHGDTSMEVDETEEEGSKESPAKEAKDGLLKEPLYAEFVRFLNLLLEISLDSEHSLRSMVSVAVLEQIILCLRHDSHQFLQFVPLHLMDGIIRSTYDVLTFEQLLAYICLGSARARKIGARLLCQLHLSKAFGD